MILRNYAILCLFAMVGCTAKSTQQPPPVYSVSNTVNSLSGNDFLSLVKSKVTCPWADETVDTFKEGNPAKRVTGIATTFMATQAVLEKAVAKGLNLIVTHEPTFYNHLDTREMVEDKSVYQYKLEYIREHELMIFRFHDHLHRTSPDGIYAGVINDLGWKAFQTSEKMVFKMPSTTLGDMAEYLKAHYQSSTIRVVGLPSMSFTKVGLSVGAHGAANEIGLLGRDDVELLIAGEVREWETVEYVRDAQIQGKNKALIVMGHADSEEAGMRYCAEWLKSFIPDVPIEHIPAGNPLWSP